KIEAGQRGSSDRRDVAELDDARDPQVPHWSFRLDADRLADGEMLLVCHRLVDHDLVAVWPVSIDERERVERGVAPGDAEAEVRRSAVDNRLAVLADQLGRP